LSVRQFVSPLAQFENYLYGQCLPFFVHVTCGHDKYDQCHNDLK